MDNCIENVIEWVTGDEFVYVTFSQKRFVTKIKRLAEKDSNVVIKAENQDGSIYAKLPLSYIKVSPKKKVEMSEERKAQMVEILRQAREKNDE